MAGQKNAPQAEKPKPLGGEDRRGQAGRGTDRQGLPRRRRSFRPRLPPPPPAPEAKPEPKPEQAKKETVQPDPIAEALKKDEAKKPVKAEAKPAPKKPTQEYVFDPNKTAALLDKRAPQRHAAAGDALNATATLGSRQRQRADADAKRDRCVAPADRGVLERCRWAPPMPRTWSSVSACCSNRTARWRPSRRVMNRGSSPFFQVYAESAVRADPGAVSPTGCRSPNTKSGRTSSWISSRRDMFGG